jgi:menaquinone-dependent protoporphyrinogen oxidase
MKMKKVLIAYETLHGSSQKCAMMLKEKLKHETELIRLKENENIDLSEYDILIVGGSIHMGVIHTRIKNFVKKNFDQIMEKPHGLFLCCMEEGDAARIQFENAFPEKLRSTSIANGLFGGEFIFRKMNLFQRTFTRRIARVSTSISRINFNEINKFVEKINTAV